MIEGQDGGQTKSRLKYGMIGGGQGAFIGDVHRKAIAMDGVADLVSGCFSKDFDNTLRTGENLGLAKERLYPSFEEMFISEKEQKDELDFVVIVTPNVSHFLIAKLALENGLHVVCDKPLTTSSRDAEELAGLAVDKDLLFMVTYAYTGYPVVKHAKEMVSHGDLGEIRFVSAEYPQDWLATPLEKSGQKQSVWRNDPEQIGVSNCVGDIGSHIENMVSFITGLNIRSLCARLDTFVEGRALDDNASILVNYDNGAKGMYWSSQVAIGFDNGFRVRIFGTKGSIDWCQERPNYLRVATLGKPVEIISRGRTPLYPNAQKYSRIPAGHPEGYYEAFANLYSAFGSALNKKLNGEIKSNMELDFPDIHTGVRGVKYIEKCVESSRAGAAWMDL
ncbi:Gfo/Idh/MocA family protein [Acidobacteriota bacterium]